MLPRGKYGTAPSSARAPSVTSWGATSWVTSIRCSAWPAAPAISSMTPFISATYASRVPKSVVSVMMALNAPRDGQRSPIAVHHEIRHQRQELALFRPREDLEVRLGRLRVRVGALAGVL